MSQFSNYALWFNLKKNDKNAITDGLREIYDNLISNYQIIPKVKFNFEDMFLEIGEDFYLIRTEEHWSPGDIAGMYNYKYLDDDEQVMAILISRNYYISHHGIKSLTPDELNEWHSFPDKYKLIRKENS